MNRGKDVLDRFVEELSALSKDLQPIIEQAAPDWDQLVEARFTIGPEAFIKASDLALEFLRYLYESEKLLKNHFELFGEDYTDKIERFTAALRSMQNSRELIKRIVSEIGEQASRRFAAGTILQGPRSHYDTSTSDTPGFKEEFDGWNESIVDQIFHSVIEADRDQSVLQSFRNSDRYRQVSSELKASPGSHFRLVEEFLFHNERMELAKSLREYRASSLCYPWLPSNQQSEMAIDKLTEIMKAQFFTIETPRDVDLPYEIRTRIEQLLIHFDFDSLFDEFTSVDSVLKTGEGHHGFPVNTIPSADSDNGVCAPVLIALARGRTGKHGFQSVIEAVKTHLIHCSAVSKLVIVMTDTWDSPNFQKYHYDQLSAWRKKGVHFIFIQVGVPRDEYSTIPVDLS